MHIHDAMETAYKNGFEQGKFAARRPQARDVMSDYDKVFSVLKGNAHVEKSQYHDGATITIRCASDQVSLVFDERGRFVEVAE